MLLSEIKIRGDIKQLRGQCNAGYLLQSRGQGQAGTGRAISLKQEWIPQSGLSNSQFKSRWWPAEMFCLIHW